MAFPKPHREVHDGFKAFVLTKRCAVCNAPAVDPAHMVARGAFGSDWTQIPLCRTHHSEQHNIGLPEFQRRHRINVYRIAHSLVVEYFTAGAFSPLQKPA
jgi:hypothetical protein